MRIVAATQRAVTNLEEEPELAILLNLVLQPLFSEWKMAKVKRVGQSKLRSGLQEHITDPLDDGELLPLSHVKLFKQIPVALSKVQNISEDFVDEVVHDGWPDNIGRSQGFDEELVWRYYGLP